MFRSVATLLQPPFRLRFPIPGLPTCFLNLMTLKRSKSFNALRLAILSLFFAHALSPNFFSTSVASQIFLTAPLRAPRGSLGMTMGVRDRWERGVAWRGTTLSAVEPGPSTRTCGSVSTWARISASAQRGGWRQGRSTYALVVDDLDDGGKLALKGALGEEDDTADLDEPPLRCLDLCVTHCG